MRARERPAARRAPFLGDLSEWGRTEVEGFYDEEEEEGGGSARACAVMHGQKHSVRMPRDGGHTAITRDGTAWHWLPARSWRPGDENN